MGRAYGAPGASLQGWSSGIWRSAGQCHASRMSRRRRIAWWLVCGLATILYWTALGLDFLALQYCHGLNCAIGASARAARANETLAIGGALFLLLAAGVLVAAMRRAGRMRS
ncbi:hypothetical protein OMP43_17580 [Sphingomonas sp. CBMAI 2297]|nr:hypothetical protein [Sphingomonas sp. CBMAI 2297]